MITITQQNGCMKAVASFEIEEQIGVQNIDTLEDKLRQQIELQVFDYFKSERDKAAEEYYTLINEEGSQPPEIEDRLDFLESLVGGGDNPAWKALMRMERRARLEGVVIDA